MKAIRKNWDVAKTVPTNFMKSKNKLKWYERRSFGKATRNSNVFNRCNLCPLSRGNSTYLDWLVRCLGLMGQINELVLIERKDLPCGPFGLEKPKDPILEYLAVMKLVKNQRAYFVFSWPTGSGKNLAGQVNSKCYWSKFCSYVFRWGEG